MTRVGLLVPVLLHLAGCVQSEQPLIPELKGRWTSDHVLKVRAVLLADDPGVTQLSTQELCRSNYMTFDKGGITLHCPSKKFRFLDVREVKRDGPRLTLIGTMPFFRAMELRIDLLLDDGGVRFRDIGTPWGSFASQPVIGPAVEKTRRLGVRTAGEMFRLMFDLNACRT